LNALAVECGDAAADDDDGVDFDGL